MGDGPLYFAGIWDIGAARSVDERGLHGVLAKVRKMHEIDEYERLALETGAFRDIELEILRESLDNVKARPDGPYSIVEVRDGKMLAGFALLYKDVNTDFTWDVTALCVGSGYRDKGAVAAKLLELVEEKALGNGPSAIVRFETSLRKAESVGRGFLLSAGYALIGHIVDFYEKGDDYFIYARHISRRRPEGQGDGDASWLGDSGEGSGL
jgi:hypothetical protein